MQYIGYIIDKLLRNHIYTIRVIHWISYQPFEQPGPSIHLDISIIYGKDPNFKGSVNVWLYDIFMSLFGKKLLGLDI